MIAVELSVGAVHYEYWLAEKNQGALGVHSVSTPFLSAKKGTADIAAALKGESKQYLVKLYSKRRNVMVSTKVVILQTLRCPIRVVFVYRKTQWVALFTTDMTLSIKQILEFYGARWKIESGFNEIKQDIGSSKSQTRNAHAVRNHLNFCMMATTVTWLYAIKLSNTPERRHMVLFCFVTKCFTPIGGKYSAKPFY